MSIRLILSFAVLAGFLAACQVFALPQPTPTPPPSLGAGFRYSTYGPAYDPGPNYWASIGQQMAGRFPNAVPEMIWIVSNVDVQGTVFTFPGQSDAPNIHFSSKDRNEAALTRFDEAGVRVWLQVEPGDALVEQLIDIILTRYGKHSCVIGVGVDVEWHHAYDKPGGQAVSDAEALAWLAAARAHNPRYRLFLKHWELEMMPPTARQGILFVNDSQQFNSLDEMVAEFAEWGRHFAPGAVGFQFGYDADRKWWQTFGDPPRAIGEAILARTPNTQGLYWVDFTVLQVFKP